jgi:hypothetical protein
MYADALCADHCHAQFNNEPKYLHSKIGRYKNYLAVGMGGNSMTQASMDKVAELLTTSILTSIYHIALPDGTSDVVKDALDGINKRALIDLTEIADGQDVYVIYKVGTKVRMQSGTIGSKLIEDIIRPDGLAYGTGVHAAKVEITYQRLNGIVDHHAVMRFAAQLDGLTSETYDIVYGHTLDDIFDLIEYASDMIAKEIENV